jgi:N-acetylmuramate 1-kinase
MTDRADLRCNFLKQQGYNPEHLSFLASDMSPRQYYRLSNPPRVLMDSPQESPVQFIQVAEFLKKQGVRAPEIFETDLSQGFVMLEDFGNVTFRRLLLKEPNEIEKLYTLAVHVLQHLHEAATSKTPFLENYSLGYFINGVMLFIDWVWPATFGQTAPDAVKEEFKNLWAQAFMSVPSVPNSMMLRDYHVDNLMLLPGKTPLDSCGVLDFQDAMWGPVVYDFISLLEDARYDAPPALMEKLWQLFLAPVPKDQHENYKMAASILATSRHVRVLGVFTRYAMRQNRRDYLIHIPRLWRYIENHFATEPTLKNLASWFHQYFPKTVRHIPPFLSQAA